MRNGFYTLLAILVILSCGFVRKTDLVQEQASISKAIVLIKKYVSVENREITNVTIVNSHNGRYTITSSILAGPDSVRLLTHVIDMIGGKRVQLSISKKRTFYLSWTERLIPSTQ